MSPVEIVVSHLAAWLGDERAAVAGCTVEPSLLEAPPGRMVRADGVVRAECGRPQRMEEVVLEMAPLLNEPAA